MSGICGFVNPEHATEQAMAVRRMAEAMRIDPGDPVETAIFSSGGFGTYRRTSSFSGARTVGGPAGPLTLAWDAEILNLPELRESLGVPEEPGKEDGIAAILSSLYQRKREEMFSSLDGSFAVSIWDEAARTLLVGIDRFRVKPVYIREEGSGLRFASKLRGVLAAGDGPREIDLGAIVDFLDASIIHTPRTILRGVRRLPAGCLLSWKDGKSRIGSYWDLRYSEDPSIPEEIYARQVKESLDESIRSLLALEGDTGDLGAFLSGGVDSTTVVGILKRHAGSRVKAFSIGFGEDKFNEMGYARIGARHFGVEHHEYFVTPEDTREIIPKLAEEYDEPYANASAVPTFYCVKVAREHGVNSIFAGDGGDEIFAGNERYGGDKVFLVYRNVPRILRTALIEPTVGFLSRTGMPPFPKAMKYIRRANIPSPDRMLSYSPSRTIPMYEEMLDGALQEAAFRQEPFWAYRERYKVPEASSELNRFMYLDMKGAIADNDLPKVTRMSELAGLKVHFPFLSYRLAEIAGRIPSDIKMRGFQLRSFFKRTYRDFLPQETIRKQKHGFGLPIPVWLRTDPGLNEMAHELVLSPRAIQRGYFRKPFLEEIFRRHQSDTSSFYGTMIWNLMILELWHRVHFDSAGS